MIGLTRIKSPASLSVWPSPPRSKSRVPSPECECEVSSIFPLALRSLGDRRSRRPCSNNDHRIEERKLALCCLRPISTMSLAASRLVATRALARRAPAQQQKRGIFDYLTNYPDKVRWWSSTDALKEPGYIWITHSPRACFFAGCRNEKGSMRWRNSARRGKPYLVEATQWQVLCCFRIRFVRYRCWPSYRLPVEIGYWKGKDWGLSFIQKSATRSFSRCWWFSRSQSVCLSVCL